jgi:putative endonuclease
MFFYVYVLRSEYDGSIYIGSTKNAETRLKKHNKGDCHYTKGRRPWKIIHQETFETRTEALKREHFLKSDVGRKQLKQLLASNNADCPMV